MRLCLSYSGCISSAVCPNRFGVHARLDVWRCCASHHQHSVLLSRLHMATRRNIRKMNAAHVDGFLNLWRYDRPND